MYCFGRGDRSVQADESTRNTRMNDGQTLHDSEQSSGLVFATTSASRFMYSNSIVLCIFLRSMLDAVNTFCIVVLRGLNNRSRSPVQGIRGLNNRRLHPALGMYCILALIASAYNDYA